MTESGLLPNTLYDHFNVINIVHLKSDILKEITSNN